MAYETLLAEWYGKFLQVDIGTASGWGTSRYCAATAVYNLGASLFGKAKSCLSRSVGCCFSTLHLLIIQTEADLIASSHLNS